MEQSWKTGEPGVSFRDKMDKDNPNPHLGKIFASNPCFEFNSIVYNSCNLGSINLIKSYDYENKIFDFDKFSDLIKKSIRFIDNMITVNKLPLEKLDEVTKKLRSVGLGVMSFADLLYLLEIPYGDKKSFDFADQLFKHMLDIAKNESISLAEEKFPYEEWKNSKNKIKIRNSNFLSIAPTGSISFIANVSGGIEPNFGLVYQRKTNEGDIYYITNEIFEKKLKELNIFSNELLNKIIENKGSCQGIKEIPIKIQKIFKIASDISPINHTKMVSVIQQHVDLAISKSVNLSNLCTVNDIEDVYMYAWNSNCKGITVYRDGCRENQVLSVGNIKKQENNKLNNIKPITRENLGEVLQGSTYTKQVACGKLYITLNRDENNNIVEVFVDTGKSGGCEANAQCLGRLTSTLCRSGVEIDCIIDSIKGVRCGACATVKGSKKKDVDGISCGDVLAKTIEKEYKKLQKIKEKNENNNEIIIEDNNIFIDDSICPECHEPLQMIEGCKKCMNCFYSKCN